MSHRHTHTRPHKSTHKAAHLPPRGQQPWVGLVLPCLALAPRLHPVPPLYTQRTCAMPVAPNTPAAAPAKMLMSPRTCSTACVLCVSAGKDNWRRSASSLSLGAPAAGAMLAAIMEGSIILACLCAFCFVLVASSPPACALPTWMGGCQ